VTVTSAHKKVTVSWVAPNATVTSYVIYRGMVANSLSALTSVGAATLSYTDSNVIRGVIYYYGVEACNSHGCSPMSVVTSGVPH
jgi:hypothetical protein